MDYKVLNKLNTGLGVKKQVIISKTIKLTTDIGPVNGFYVGAVSLGDFEIPFNSVPTIFGSMASANGITILIGITGTSKTSWGTAHFVSNMQRTDMDMAINLIAIDTK